MFIVPINSSIRPIESFFDDAAKKTASNEDSPSFSNVFKELWGEVESTQQVAQDDQIKLINGEIDDLHTIYNNMTKASIALETFSAVKNTAIDSYKEILQMNL